MIPEKFRYQASPFMDKKRSCGCRRHEKRALCGALNAISNRPREEKNSLNPNPSITEEVIINY